MYAIPLNHIIIYHIYDHIQPDTEVQRRSPDRRCNTYAYIKEDASGAKVTVCGGETRYRHLYTAVSGSVEIQIVNTGDNGDDSSYFVIAFQGKPCCFVFI